MAQLNPKEMQQALAKPFAPEDLSLIHIFWVEIEKRGRSFVIKDSERARLDNAYLSALKRLGLTPAAACGIQSLLTPKTLPGQTAPEENAPAASPQPKQGNSQPAPASALQRADQPATRSDSQQTQPVQQSRAAASRTVPFALPQSAARQRTDCYVVLSTKVQGGMSGSSTLVTLRAPDGKQIPAFARGARPELSTGTVLSNVKLTMRQQDTVAFYVLESYEIVPQEDLSLIHIWHCGVDRAALMRGWEGALLSDDPEQQGLQRRIQSFSHQQRPENLVISAAFGDAECLAEGWVPL